MRQLVGFLMQMDAYRWRVLFVGVLLLAGITLLFAVGRQHFGLVEEDLALWLEGSRANHFGLLATIVLFTVSAFVGAPQFLLIALCVLVFGPWYGFVYSWVATVFSAGVTYWCGRGPLARVLDRLGKDRSAELKSFIGKNAFAASFIVRNVPSAPFIVVNAGFGAVRASFISYLSGCALGVLPKTAVVAFFGGSFMTAVAGDGVWSSFILMALALAWLAIMMAVREWIRRRHKA